MNSVIPALCLLFGMGYAVYFALKEQVQIMLLGGVVFGLGAIHQIAELRNWYQTGRVPSPDWILGDSVETAVYLLAVVSFLFFTFYYRRTRSLLQEKDILLDEINHRVKNNLQAIQSLLSIYEKRRDEYDLTEILREVRNKIDSFALLHEQLHETNNIREVDAREYLKNLCNELEKTKPDNKDVTLMTSLESVHLPVEKMIACGLIVTELVSNAFSHGFPDDRSGTVEVRLTGDNPYHLEVTDTGTGGLEEEVEEETKRGGGLDIVHSIVQLELQGGMSIEANGGTTASITFTVS